MIAGISVERPKWGGQFERQDDHLVLFEVLGYLAVIDGQVTNAEVLFAENLIAQSSKVLGIDRRLARQHFDLGANRDFDLAEAASRLQTYSDSDISGTFRLLAVFIQRDARNVEVKQQVLYSLGAHLGLDQAFIRQEIYGNRQQHQYRRQTSGSLHPNELAEAYNALGVDEKDSDALVKRRYRKLMAQYHPDRLQSKDLPKRLLDDAKEKVRRFNNAWDTIKAARGIA